MLTYEQVLKEFESYLTEDSMCEVESTSEGYIVILIDDVVEGPFESTLCQSPEHLQQVLEEYRCSFEEYNSLI